eukprot:GILK01013831.1.p1 GENE.GILK01013831.1~~GILK01013831.1.p1  ORF type:complete len:230 (-),score=18.04 GILK01013831.1:421-1032(-)
MDHLKSAVELFVRTKAKLDPRHEYGICVLQETSTWFLSFTSNVELFVEKLRTLSVKGDFKKFEMASLFDAIAAKRVLPDVTDRSGSIPYVVRMLFIYGRSAVIPNEGRLQNQTHPVIAHPAFYYDALYLHEKPSDTNNPQAVYDFITSFEPDEQLQKFSFFFECSSNVARLYKNMAALLAHARQRKHQTLHASGLDYLSKPSL